MSGYSVSDLQKALGDIADFAERLEPAAVNRRVQHWRRYGLPSSSMPEFSSGTAEPALPWPDSVDEDLKKTVLGYRRDIDEALRALERAMRRQNALLIDAPALQDELPIPCGNLACTKDLEAGRNSGECTRCRVWRSRNDGLAYPQQRQEAV